MRSQFEMSNNDPCPPTSASNSEKTSPGEVEEVLVEKSLGDLLLLLRCVHGEPQWEVPISPTCAFPMLLQHAVSLAREGEDEGDAICQKFYSEHLLRGFRRIMNESVLVNWDSVVLGFIYEACRKLIDLLILKLAAKKYTASIYEAASLVLSISNTFHKVSHLVELDGVVEYQPQYTAHLTKGYWMHLLNQFGASGGFEHLMTFCESPSLPNLYPYARILACASSGPLTPHTISTVIKPCTELILTFLLGHSEADVKQFCRQDSLRLENVDGTIPVLHSLVKRVDIAREKLPVLEDFRLMVFRSMLEEASFNVKMTVLTEIHDYANDYANRLHEPLSAEDFDWLRPAKIKDWLVNANILSLLLRENFHVSQYVERVEKLIEFLTMNQALTNDDLNAIWEYQAGKHDAIVVNIHNMLSRLALRFSPGQLDHLFSCFERTALTASKKGQESILRLIRCIAEGAKGGVVVRKVLNLQWNLIYRDKTHPEIVEQAIPGLVAVLSKKTIGDAVKESWILKCVGALKNRIWVLRSLKLMRKILLGVSTAFPPGLARGHHAPRTSLEEVLSKLVSSQNLFVILCEDLSIYMENVHANYPDIASSSNTADTFKPDGHYTHQHHIAERLNFMRFLFHDGALYTSGILLKSVWDSLMKRSVFATDADMCLTFLCQLIGGSVADISKSVGRSFMRSHIQLMEPATLTELRFRCFSAFFHLVNGLDSTENGLDSTDALQEEDPQPASVNVLDFLGWDYLWKVLEQSSDTVAFKASQLMSRIVAVPASADGEDQNAARTGFIDTCVSRLEDASQSMVNTNGPGPAVCELASGTSTTPAGPNCKVKLCRRIIFLLCDFVHKLDVKYVDSGRPLPHTPLKRIHAMVSEMQTTGDAAHANPVQSSAYALSATGMASPASSSSSSSSASSSSPIPIPLVIERDQLPSVILSERPRLFTTLLNIMDSATHCGFPEVTDSCQSLLYTLPIDPERVAQLHTCLADESEARDRNFDSWTDGMSPCLRSFYVDTSSARAWYNLEVLHSIIFPEQLADHNTVTTCQENFVRAGGLSCLVTLMRGEGFLREACSAIKRSAHRIVLRLGKLFFAAAAHARVYRVLTGLQEDNIASGQAYDPCLKLRSEQLASLVGKTVGRREYSAACKLDFALDTMPLDQWVGEAAKHVSYACAEELLQFEPSEQLLNSVLRVTKRSALSHDDDGSDEQPEGTPAKVPASYGGFSYSDPYENLKDAMASIHGLQALTLLAAFRPHLAHRLIVTEKEWQSFIFDMLLFVVPQHVRVCAMEMFYAMLVWGLKDRGTAQAVMERFFSALPNLPKLQRTVHGHAEFFNLFCKLLPGWKSTQHLVECLASVSTWLDSTCKQARSGVGIPPTLEPFVSGYLKVTRSLVKLVPLKEKEDVGTGSRQLIQKLLVDFLFPFSSPQDTEGKRERRRVPAITKPVCQTPAVRAAAFSTLVELSHGCERNIGELCSRIERLFYTGIDVHSIQGWSYMPNVEVRAANSYVGLRNAAATCYMNAILQILFMIAPIRHRILAVNNAGWDEVDKALAQPDKETPLGSPSSLLDLNHLHLGSGSPPIIAPSVKVDAESSVDSPAPMTVDVAEADRSYPLALLRHLQHVFGQLESSQTPEYAPVGFWRTFKMPGKEMFLTEQCDALEFMNCLTDNVDQALSALGQPRVFEETFGGVFADQKICKSCPHRFSKASPFSSIAVDIQDSHRLTDSLAEYVKGDLLDGDNQYHCETCDTKVDAEKRLTFDKLPKHLVVLFKRFKYDWNKGEITKSNKRFEFNLELDMYPYTARGLAHAEDNENGGGDENAMDCSDNTKYTLSSVVVHQGQATHGHYYSFVRRKSGRGDMWYKFDDTTVTECQMTDRDISEMFFGGGEQQSRNGLRARLKTYSAYLLFYERNDITTLSSSPAPSRDLPQHVVQAVQHGNLVHAHQRAHFSHDYFTFIQNLLRSCVLTERKPSGEEESSVLAALPLICKFVFAIVLRCDHSLRGHPNQWLGPLLSILEVYSRARKWFVQNILLRYPELICELLVDCPHIQVRRCFAIFLAQLCIICQQETFSSPESDMHSLLPPAKAGSRSLMLVVVQVLQSLIERMSLADHSPQGIYMFFMKYAEECGDDRLDLFACVKSELPLINLMLKDKSGCQELQMIHKLIIRLLLSRHCNAKELRSNNSSIPVPSPRDNPYGHYVRGDINDDLYNVLFVRRYIDKVLLEMPASDHDVRQLIKFLCWENPHSSLLILSQFLAMITTTAGTGRPSLICSQLKNSLEALSSVLDMDDPWQLSRISMVLNGKASDSGKDGLLVMFNKMTLRVGQSDVNRPQRVARACVFLAQRCPKVKEHIFRHDSLLKYFVGVARFLNRHRENFNQIFNRQSTPSTRNEEKVALAELVAFCEEVLSDVENWKDDPVASASAVATPRVPAVRTTVNTAATVPVTAVDLEDYDEDEEDEDNGGNDVDGLDDAGDDKEAGSLSETDDDTISDADTGR